MILDQSYLRAIIKNLLRKEIGGFLVINIFNITVS
jgi:hypothetical protein